MPTRLTTLEPNARILVVRLGSLGDIVLTLPAVQALRQRYPQARIDWLVETKWLPLLESVPLASNVIPLAKDSWGEIWRVMRTLRATRYQWAIDFQGLYKSALCAYFSGARQRLGFWDPREAGARMFYNEPLMLPPRVTHAAQRNLALASLLGAADGLPEFPEFSEQPAAASYVRDALAQAGMERYYVISPGGGWRSKCWPAEDYGHLHRRFAEKHRLRAIVSYGPGEKALAESVRVVAGEPAPLLLPMSIPQLIAALRGCEFFVGADTGPLHLAAALGRRTVALFGPTDPRRNGPLGIHHQILRNVSEEQTTYKRGADYSPAMRSIKVEQVLAACEKLLPERAGESR